MGGLGGRSAEYMNAPEGAETPPFDLDDLKENGSIQVDGIEEFGSELSIGDIKENEKNDGYILTVIDPRGEATTYEYDITLKTNNLDRGLTDYPAAALVVEDGEEEMKNVSFYLNYDPDKKEFLFKSEASEDVKYDSEPGPGPSDSKERDAYKVQVTEETEDELVTLEFETKLSENAEKNLEQRNEKFEDLLYNKLNLLAEQGETRLLESLDAQANIYLTGLNQVVREKQALELDVESGRYNKDEAHQLMLQLNKEMLLQLARIKRLFDSTELTRGWFKRNRVDFDNEFYRLVSIAEVEDGVDFDDAMKVAELENEYYSTGRDRRKRRKARKIQKKGFGFAIGLKPGVEIGKNEDREKRYVRVRYPQSRGEVERITGQEALSRGVTEYTYLTQDGLVTEKHLHKMSLDEIFDIAEQYDLSKNTIEAKTIKSALLRQVILEGATTDSGVITRMGGREAFWSLMDEVLVDSQFSKDLYLRYWELRKIGEALTKDQRIQDHEEFKEKFYGLSMWNDDEIMTAALVDTLSDAAQEKEGWDLPKEKTRPRELLNLFRGAEGEIDFAQVSSQASILYEGETPLYEEPSRWDQTRKGGLMKGVNSILADQVAEGNISKEFAANTSSFLHKAGNLVDKAPAIALVWHGVKAARHTLGALGKVVVGDWKGAGEGFKEVGKDLGKGLLWGVGGRMAFDAFKGESPWNPRGWGEHIHPLNESDEQYEQRIYDEQIESGILFETKTLDDLVRRTIGSQTIEQLMTPPPVLRPASNGALVIDRSTYIEQYPDAEKDPDIDKKLQIINQKLAEYGFTAELARELENSDKPFMDIIDELKGIDDSTAAAREVLKEGGFPDQLTVAELYLLEEAERTKKIERMQFTAQQWAKLNPDKLSDWAWEQMEDAGTAKKPMGTRPPSGPYFWFGKALEEMLAATDTKGNSGEAFLRTKLEDVLKGGTDKEITDYFRGVNIVFNNHENIEFGWEKPDEAALYVDGETKGVSFVEYIHEYNPLGTGTPLGAEYTSPGMGNWNSSKEDFNPQAEVDGKGNTWRSILERTYTLSPEETSSIETSGGPVVAPTRIESDSSDSDVDAPPEDGEKTTEPEIVDEPKNLGWKEDVEFSPDDVDKAPEKTRYIELNQENMPASILAVADPASSKYFIDADGDKKYKVDYKKLHEDYPDAYFVIPTGFSYDFNKVQGKVFSKGKEVTNDEKWLDRPIIQIDSEGKVTISDKDSIDESEMNENGVTAFQMPESSASYLKNAKTKTPRFLVEQEDGSVELVELSYESELSVTDAAKQLQNSEKFANAQNIVYMGTGKGSYKDQQETMSGEGVVLVFMVEDQQE